MCHYFCAILSMLIVAVAVVAHSFPLNVTFESNDTIVIDDTLWSLVNLSSDSFELNGTIYSAPQATDTLLTITIIVAGCLLLTVLYVLFVDPRVGILC
uniref:Secreted protein n=1 Tax=Globodera pallida TaxID=36090 RepID=A0A183CKV8_GLOPA